MIQRLKIHSASVRKATGLDYCFVVIQGDKVIENGPVQGLHPTDASARATL